MKNQKNTLKIWENCLKSQVSLLNKKQTFCRAVLLTRETPTSEIDTTSILSDSLSYFVVKIETMSGGREVASFDFNVNDCALSLYYETRHSSEICAVVKQIVKCDSNSTEELTYTWSQVYTQLRDLVRLLTDQPAPPIIE